MSKAKAKEVRRAIGKEDEAPPSLNRRTLEAAERLRKLVWNYESDTFSAVGLDDVSLDIMCAKLIDRIEQHLDGVTLTMVYEDRYDD